MTKKQENKFYHKALLIAKLQGINLDVILNRGCTFCSKLQSKSPMKGCPSVYYKYTIPPDSELDWSRNARHSWCLAWLDEKYYKNDKKT